MCPLRIPLFPSCADSPFNPSTIIYFTTYPFARSRNSLSTMSSQAAPPASANGDVVEMVSHPSPGLSSNDYSWEKGRVAGVEVAKDEVHDDHDEHRTATKSTRDDAENMRRMGRSQQLVRHFRLLSMTSFVAIATAAWEIG